MPHLVLTFLTTILIMSCDGLGHGIYMCSQFGVMQSECSVKRLTVPLSRQRKLMCKYSHRCARTLTHTHTHTQARAHAHTQENTHAHAHAHTQAHAHTHTHTHTRTHTLTHTHTHTRT